MRARWRTALLWAALAVGPAQATVPWKPPDTDDWVEARTAHFTIYSNASDRVTRKSATELERFRQALERMTTGLQLDLLVPTSIIILRNEAMFRPYSRDERGRAGNVSGYFLSGPFQNYIVLDASAEFSPLKIVFHEYVHAILSDTVGMLPLWLDEGLAQYFETFKMRVGLGVAEVGHPIESNLDFMNYGAMLPWKDVFRVRLDSSAYKGGLHQGAFYSQSWLLVHYLWSSPDRARALPRYLTLLRDGTDPEAALRTALGLDRASLAAGAEAYRSKVSPFVLWDFGDGQVDVPVTLREIRPPEVLFRLGDLLARQGQVQAARLHFDAARAGGWPIVPIETALGYGSLQSKDLEGGRSHLEKAVGADSPSVEAFVLLAGLKIDEAVEKLETAAVLPSSVGAPADVLEARGFLERALQRDAKDFHALVSLARTYLFEGDTGVGVATLAKARQVRPLAPEVQLLGACLLGRGGKVAEAWSTVRDEIAPRNETLAEESRTCVVMATIEAARERLIAGDRPGARDVMNAAMDTIEELPYRRRLEALHGMVNSGKEVPMLPQENTLRKRFAAAVTLANSGDQERALERLKALREECFGDDLCPRIRETIDALAKMMARNEMINRFNDAVALYNEGRAKAALAVLEEIHGKTTDAEILRLVDNLRRRLGWKPPKE